MELIVTTDDESRVLQLDKDLINDDRWLKGFRHITCSQMTHRKSMVVVSHQMWAKLPDRFKNAPEHRIVVIGRRDQVEGSPVIEPSLYRAVALYDRLSHSFNHLFILVGQVFGSELLYHRSLKSVHTIRMVGIQTGDWRLNLGYPFWKVSSIGDTQDWVPSHWVPSYSDESRISDFADRIGDILLKHLRRGGHGKDEVARYVWFLQGALSALDASDGSVDSTAAEMAREMLSEFAAAIEGREDLE